MYHGRFRDPHTKCAAIPLSFEDLLPWTHSSRLPNLIWVVAYFKTENKSSSSICLLNERQLRRKRKTPVLRKYRWNTTEV
jgi:hypothetical protein